MPRKTLQATIEMTFDGEVSIQDFREEIDDMVSTFLDRFGMEITNNDETSLVTWRVKDVKEAQDA